LKRDEDAVRATGPLNVTNTLPERQQAQVTAYRINPRIGDGHHGDKPQPEQQPEEDELA
jgi:hypothetical protein